MGVGVCNAPVCDVFKCQCRCGCGCGCWYGWFWVWVWVFARVHVGGCVYVCLCVFSCVPVSGVGQVDEIGAFVKTLRKVWMQGGL